MSSSLLFITCAMLFFATTISTTEAALFDWQSALDELQLKRSAWDALGITTYEFRHEISCFCDPCYTADKYVTVADDSVTNIEFINAKDPARVDCVAQTPLDAHYQTMADLFDAAVAHAERGVAADCAAFNESNPFGGGSVFVDEICGGSAVAAFDDTYHYLTALYLIHGPFVADAGSSHTMGCLSITESSGVDVSGFAYLSTYANHCRYPWAGVCAALQSHRDAFLSHALSEYTYTSARDACECTPCATVKRIIEVGATAEGNTVVSVAFDENAFGCGRGDLHAPRDTTYTLASIFEHAIAYCTSQIDNGCAGVDRQLTANHAGCDSDASLEVSYDAAWSYITRIVFDRAAMAYDGGSAFTYDCIDGCVAPCICTLEYNPYCCEDGQTYSNPCMVTCGGVYAVDECSPGACPKPRCTSTRAELYECLLLRSTQIPSK